MKTFINYIVFLIALISFSAWSQENLTSSIRSNSPVDNTADLKKNARQEVVVVTGVRFAYPLIQKWIDDYAFVNKDVQIVVESRGSNDPLKYDILIEAYEHEEEVKKTRDYLHFARYAILPVANSKSTFSKIYSEKGLNRDLITQLYFHDIFADKEKEQKIKAPYTVYTRMQKAGSPIVFTKYFGYEQKNITGKVIAGADEHLLKALLRDSTAISYLPLSIIYDKSTKTPVNGLAVLPVDLNNNGKINDDEKFYGDLTTVIKRLEEKPAKEIYNVPMEYLHFSVDKNNTSEEAVEFLKWVLQNGLKDLADFGFIQPEPYRIESGRFGEYSSRRNN